ncbi:Thiosulfate sulfurtransferase TUM1 [Spathaspora sp. JA1]|nr:Thiosulfate sulfurtransferase TUM1 [Spathaspora sp. JA1]
MAKPILSTITPTAYRALLSRANGINRVIPIDATWVMPNVPRVPAKEFLEIERIKNSAFFDLDKYCGDSPYPHMLPSQSVFNDAMNDLGLKSTDSIVVYDTEGNFSSPRAAWTFSLFGHCQVYLLDNYLNYKKSSFPLDTSKVESFRTPLSSEQTSNTPIPESEFKAKYKEQVIEYEELLDLVETNQLSTNYLALDARSLGRFAGEADEPRKGLSSGHVPGTKNLPFPKVLETTNKQYKSKQEILQIFANDLNIDFSNDEWKKQYPKGIIVMCGTGVSAVILRFALTSILGLDVPVRVYDGSWTEWAQRAPKEFIVKGDD